MFQARGLVVYFYTAYSARAGVIGNSRSTYARRQWKSDMFVSSFYFHVRVGIRAYISNFLVIMISQFVTPCSVLMSAKSHVCKSLFRQNVS